jgi:hypothetical protein
MRRTIGQSLRIGVSGHAVSLLRVSRWKGEAATVLAEHAFPPTAEHPHDAIAQALRALLGELELAGWPVSFVLADELTRLWQVTPPAGATRMADLEASAALRFQALYGESPAAWQISADWDASQPFFAAAVPRTLLAELRLVAQEYQLSVVAIEPHFTSAWNRWHRVLTPGAWFGLMHDRLLTLAVIAASADSGTIGAVGGHAGHAGLRAIRALPVPPDADQQWLTQALGREALLHNLAAPAMLQVCGALPEAWARPVSHPSYIPCVALEQPQAKPAAGGEPSAAVLLARAGSLR